MGCPFPPIAYKHKGSGILLYPDEAKGLLETIRQYPDIRFSIKMRLGWESKEESLALLPFLNDLPLSHISLHPRIGKQQYKGTVDMDGFAAFYTHCNHPVVYNGNIETIEDVAHLVSLYPRLAGVMVGRGLLANPALAIECKESRAMPADEKRKKIHNLHEGVLTYYKQQLEGGEAQLLNKMKTFWEYLCPDMDRKLRKKILKSSRIDAYMQAVNEF